MFGTGNTGADNANAMIKLIKYNLPEWIENFPPFRPTVVLAEVMPTFFDYLLTYWPATADFLKETVQDRVDGKVQRDSFKSHTFE